MDMMSVFATVVEQPSLNQAAKLLNLSQPALSRRISRWEDELDLALFERRGKRLFLTRAGRMVYEHALEFRKLEQLFQQALAKHQNEDHHSIIIGASLTTIQSTLPDVIQWITQRDPDIDIQSITGKTHEILELVLENKVDFGLVASTVTHADIHCQPLFDDHLCLVIPKVHPLAAKGNVTIRDLERLPMILFSKGTWYRILMDELLNKYRVHPQIKMEIDSFEGILRLVATLQSASMLPKSYLRPAQLDDNDLTFVTIEEFKDSVRTTSFIYSRYAKIDPVIQALFSKFKANLDT